VTRRPTRKQLLAAFDIDVDSGRVFWREPPQHAKVRPGDEAGSPLKADGRWVITLDRHRMKRAQLIWFIVKRRWAHRAVAHRSADKANDGIHNLYLATPAALSQNRHRAQRNSKTGVLGVHPTSAGKFAAQIRSAGRVRTIGTFDTAAEAHAAYLAVKSVAHVKA
jgi:hypothetical protein